MMLIVAPDDCKQVVNLKARMKEDRKDGSYNMGFVAAKCTQCGAAIEVDDSQKTGICKYCGMTYTSEQVINHYNQSIQIGNATINVQGMNIENLILRGKQYEEEGDLHKALDYYNQVLDADINNNEIRDRVTRLQQCEMFLKQAREKKISAMR